ncbi:Cyclin, N-terminal [Dillenia turbinata]|uniref:Cyclin, N-terminal n=1 Tax=Dillenia turbinata TaxID=194707 RepID=A0AAN8UJH3_9MAGN
MFLCLDNIYLSMPLVATLPGIMSFSQNYGSQGNPLHYDYRPSHGRYSNFRSNNGYYSNELMRSKNNTDDFSGDRNSSYGYGYNYGKADGAPSFKRRKFSSTTWEDSRRYYPLPNLYRNASSTCSSLQATTRPDRNFDRNASFKRDRTKFDDECDAEFMSRDEIERYSPSRKDGIDAQREMHLRYSYCAFLQNLGMRLELPQITIGTAMVLCHRFFVRRSHACHDRFLVATAALFLASKSEETPRPLNNVLRASCEICHRQEFTLLSYLLPIGWFEQYRERVIEAEQMILTTLNFELNVQHPYAPLTSILNKLGLSQTVLVSLALNLISEGLRSSLWLQFKPHHIAAGAVYLAGKYLNLDLASYEHIWQEFQTTPSILQDGLVW